MGKWLQAWTHVLGEAMRSSYALHSHFLGVGPHLVLIRSVLANLAETDNVWSLNISLMCIKEISKNGPCSHQRVVANISLMGIEETSKMGSAQINFVVIGYL